MYAKLNKTMDMIEKYPYTISDLKKDHPNVSFPEPLTADVLAKFNVVEVLPTDQPLKSWSEIIKEGVPAYDALTDAWKQTWIINSAPDLDTARQQEVARIKESAFKDIVARWPEWKQRNMIADALEKLVAQLQALNVNIDTSVAQEAIDAWDWIKQRRAQSDAEEAAL